MGAWLLPGYIVSEARPGQERPVLVDELYRPLEGGLFWPGALVEESGCEKSLAKFEEKKNSLRNIKN